MPFGYRPALRERAVRDRERPSRTTRGADRARQFSYQVRVPDVHLPSTRVGVGRVLGRGLRRARRRRRHVVLERPREVVRVREEEVLRQVDELKQPHVALLGDLALRRVEPPVHVRDLRGRQASWCLRDAWS